MTLTTFSQQGLLAHSESLTSTHHIPVRSPSNTSFGSTNKRWSAAGITSPVRSPSRDSFNKRWSTAQITFPSQQKEEFIDPAPRPAPRRVLEIIL